MTPPWFVFAGNVISSWVSKHGKVHRAIMGFLHMILPSCSWHEEVDGHYSMLDSLLKFRCLPSTGISKVQQWISRKHRLDWHGSLRPFFTTSRRNKMPKVRSPIFDVRAWCPPLRLSTLATEHARVRPGAGNRRREVVECMACQVERKTECYNSTLTRMMT